MLIRIAGLAACLLLSASLYAQTAEECIAEYEGLKAQFQAVAPDAPLNCVKEGNVISLDAESALPAFLCEGLDEDHWHLQARSIGANEGSCSMRLLGVDDVEGCGTEEFLLELPAAEAAAWRKYLRDECG